MKLYLLDVSGFLFRAYFAIPPMTNPSGEATHALFGFIRSTLKLLKQEKPEHIVAVYDGPNNKKSRKAIYADYKANRVGEYEDLPEQIQRSKIFCELAGIPHLEIDGVEADDTIATVATWAEQQGMDVRICTSDKDLCQLVTDKVLLLNPWKNNALIDEQAVIDKFGVKPEQIADYLGMVGDTSDNIPGLPGFGPKTSAPLLQEHGSLEKLLAHADDVKGKKKQETLKNDAELARLSKKLATVQRDLEIPTPKDNFSLLPSDKSQLRIFYIQQGFHSLVKELDAVIGSPEQESVDYQLVDDENSLSHLITKLRQASEIAFDLETTSLKPLQAEAVGIGFCMKKKEAYYVPFNGKLGIAALKQLAPVLEECSLIGHNTKYDCHILDNYQISAHHISFDTILASYLLHPSSRSHSLDALSLEKFGKVKTSIKSLIGTGKKQISMSDVPIQKVSDYCCEDVDYTFRLKEILEQELKERKLDPLLYHLELPLSHILRKMERAGVYLNTKHLSEMEKHILEELTTVQKEIFDLAGEEFNLNSPKQLAAILFEKLAIKPLKKTTSGYSTNADVLTTLAIDYPIADLILQFRSLDKLRSTYIEALPKQVNPDTHRIHPTFNQFIAATGRLACQDPNLQNIPIRTKLGKQIREAFLPQKKGWCYLSADYSQIELRLLAHLSEDPTLIKAFQEGEDIHSYTASLMFEKKNVTKEERQRAKAINFGIIYGQQAYGLSRELKIDIHTAAAFIEAYYKRYPKVFTYLQTCIEKVETTGYATTMTGREREIPEIYSNNAHIKAAAHRLAINTPLQGSAADLIKKAMLTIDHLLVQEKFNSFLILQIHDELIFEVPNEELEALKQLVIESMEGVFHLKVPLVVDISVGNNWGQC